MTTDNQQTDTPQPRVGVVVIGRNEGQRLMRCLAALAGVRPLVYVDSGSTDGSVERARSAGADVVELPMPPPFTAARARNAGIARLIEIAPDVAFLQTVDGDCEIARGWLDAAAAALAASDRLALVFGRLRERHPERSLFNALCDDEWNVTPGPAAGSGGNAMFRVAALREAQGFVETMIAGEDSELSMRLRKAGWTLRCLDAEMGLHDADITRFGQWWRRARRAGYGFAEMAWRHPDARDPDWPRTTRSILAWGAVLPLSTLATALAGLALDRRFGLVTAALAALWPLKMLQLIGRGRARGLEPKVALASGVLLMVGKLPNALGVIDYHLGRLRARPAELIEYKGAETT